MMIGAICWSNLFEIKSAPELNFGFNCLHIFRISISEILENSKFIGLHSDKNSSYVKSEASISVASLGPIWEKKLLKPFAISK